MGNSNIPQDGFLGLRQNLSADLSAGFVAFLLALPLSLGIAKASGFPASMGLVTAIIGGLVATFFAGSRLTIKGPAAGLIVIIAGCVAAFGGGEMGWRMTLGVLVVAGLLQIGFGLLKWGRMINFFPLATIHGMLAAIGLIIIAKQLPVLLNVPPEVYAGKSPIALLVSLPEYLTTLDPTIAVIGAVSLGLMLLWPIVAKGFFRKIPAPLLILLLAIPASLFLGLSTSAPEYTLLKAGKLLDQIGLNVSFGGTSMLAVFVKYTLLIAVVGSVESLLTVKAIDAIDPHKRKSDPNKDLVAIGIANTLAGLLGGLPMISEVARSSANVASGAQTRWANLFHGLFLLVAALVAYSVLELIPNAALAAMLIAVGIKLSHPRVFVKAYQIGKSQLLVFLVTVTVTLMQDLLMGIIAGMLVEAGLHLLKGAPLKTLFKSGATIENKKEEIHLGLGEVACFSTYVKLSKVLDSIPTGRRLVINASKTKLIDYSVRQNLNEFIDEYEAGGGKVVIKGASAQAQPQPW